MFEGMEEGSTILGSTRARDRGNRWRGPGRPKRKGDHLGEWLQLLRRRERGHGRKSPQRALNQGLQFHRLRVDRHSPPQAMRSPWLTCHERFVVTTASLAREARERTRDQSIRPRPGIGPQMTGLRSKPQNTAVQRRQRPQTGGVGAPAHINDRFNYFAHCNGHL